MNQSIKDYEIEQINLQNKTCFKIRFRNILTQKTAMQITHEWKSLLQRDGSEKHIVIFNAKEMTDYEPMARIEFQKAIKELKDRTEKIWLVTNSKVIAGGASLIGLFASLPIKAVDSEDKIVV